MANRQIKQVNYRSKTAQTQPVTVVCPNCGQEFLTKYKTCPYCPRKIPRALKIILIGILLSFVVLSGLKTFSPDLYFYFVARNEFLVRIDWLIPNLDKPIGTYTLPKQ